MPVPEKLAEIVRLEGKPIVPSTLKQIKIMPSVLCLDSPLLQATVGLLLRTCGLLFLANSIAHVITIILSLALLTISSFLLVTLHVCTSLNGSNKQSWLRTSVIFIKALADFGLVLAAVYVLIQYSVKLDRGYDSMYEE